MSQIMPQEVTKRHTQVMMFLLATMFLLVIRFLQAIKFQRTTLPVMVMAPNQSLNPQTTMDLTQSAE